MHFVEKNDEIFLKFSQKESSSHPSSFIAILAFEAIQSMEDPTMNMTNSATNFLISIHDFHDVIIIYMASLRDVDIEVGTPGR